MNITQSGRPRGLTKNLLPTGRTGWIGSVAASVPLALFLWGSPLDSVAQRHPAIGYVYPAGGQQGSSFEITVGGQYLSGITGVHVSGVGVQGVIQEHDRPLPQKRINEMREKLKKVRTKMSEARKDGQIKASGDGMRLFLRLAEEEGMTRQELQKAAEYRRRQQDPKRQLNPQLAETVTVQVTMGSEAEVGMRELRLRTRSGLSNPVRFRVDQLPEVAESATDPGFNWEFLAMTGRWKAPENGRTPTPVKLPAMVNGQILPGEVDRFRFQARKGQRIVAQVSARALIPYLADAVPGWFQATLALYDSAGNEVAYADDFRFHPDPVLSYEIPDEGSYTMEIKDSIYRGREDFVYRIAVGELPYITGIFPLGGRAGQRTELELTGWNLPRRQLVIQPRLGDPDIVEVSVEKMGRISNVVPFAAGSLPELREQEPNDRSANPQPVSVPVVVNGRISQEGDWDVFQFAGREGDVVVAEVFARRLGSPLDSTLRLTDAKGRELAVNDDHEDRAAGLTTHHADSRLRTTLPEDGTYCLHLGDTQARGGAAYTYRLQAAPLKPDFKLRVVPSSVALRAGSSVPLTVHVLRTDGFTNDIQLVLADAPDGFSLGNARLSAGTNQFRVVLKATGSMAAKPCQLTLQGRASLDGRPIMHPAVPADDLMQAFIYRHLVPAEAMNVAVLKPKPTKKPARKTKSPSKPTGKPVASR